MRLASPETCAIQSPRGADTWFARVLDRGWLFALQPVKLGRGWSERASWLLLLVVALGARAAASEPVGRLGYWRFNTPEWRDEQGRPPLIASNVPAVPSFDGQALCQSATNAGGYVRFRCFEPTGRPLLHPSRGAIRFLYKPIWTSPHPLPGTTQPPRLTPGHSIRLFEAVGNGGRWMISIDPGGTNLMVHTGDALGTLRTNLQVRIDWALRTVASPTDAAVSPSPWREVIFNYAPPTCSLVIDGAVQTDWLTGGLIGPAPTPFHYLSTGDAAFAIGSSVTGEYPAEGLFDELETFDRPLSPLRNYSYLARLGPHAAITTDPPTVTLSWFTTGNERFPLQRLELGVPQSVLLATNLTGMSYTDTRDLKLGSMYMYFLGTQSLIVSLNQPPPEHRGRAIILVDETLASALKADLEQLLIDLVGDGWTVSRHNVPRHNDNAWNRGPVNPAYRSDVARIKAVVEADYRAAPAGIAAVLIVGHVTIPYSGADAEDSHPAHHGAWPADAYYGDLEGEWTDTAAATPPTITHPLLRNVPADGKFDQVMFPRPSRPDARRAQPGADLAVGRIDFARLPAFRPKSERDLLREYLAKNHRYRHKQLTFQHNALVGGFFGNPYHEESRALYDTGNLLAYRLYRPALDTVLDGNAFAGSTSAVWAVQGGYGDTTALHNSAAMNVGLGIRRVATADLAQSDPAPKIGFYVLKGSYFIDWNFADDNFLRAVLALPDSGLAAFWTRHTVWAVDLTGLGESLAATVLATARERISVRNCSLLGDPTLRPFVTAPPGRVTATRDGAAVRLAWTASPDAAQGYWVYRSAQGLNGPFARVHPSPLTATTYTDTSPPSGPLLYQVRACQLLTTGCGAFTNLSQGVMAEVRR
jgi:hypothetical protein